MSEGLAASGSFPELKCEESLSYSMVDGCRGVKHFTDRLNGQLKTFFGSRRLNLERYFAVHRIISVRIGSRSEPFTVRE